MEYEILEIKKCNEKINKSVHTTINDIKIIALSAVVLFSCKSGIINENVSDALIVGGISGGVIAVTSLVKSICNIYLTNQKKRELENELRRK